MTRHIDCPKCQGTGKKKLSKPYRQCLDLVAALGTPTVKEIFEAGNGSVCRTAVNKQVSRMIEWKVLRNVGTKRKMRVSVV